MYSNKYPHWKKKKRKKFKLMEKMKLTWKKEHMQINYAQLERKVKNLYHYYRNAFQVQVKNKLLIYKIILKSVRTNAIQLW